MENVTLHYFPFKGLGEGIRMLLTYGGQKFEDTRIPWEQWPEFKPNNCVIYFEDTRIPWEQWPEFKPKTPFGQMPVLKANGKTYSQTLAVARFLGRKYGLAGENLDEAFEIDQNMDFFTEIRVKSSTPMFEQDPEVKKKLKENLEKNYLPGALKQLNEIIGQNNGHIANGKLSWGDFVIAGVYDALKNMLFQMPDMDEKFPHIKKLKDNVLSLPKVKEYVATAAPKTEM